MVAFNSAVSANIGMLQSVNSQFQVAQKRVSTGKAIFGAADDATRYKMSEQMLSRSRSLDAINNNVSLTLKSLEATNQTLNSMKSLVEQARELTRKAQAEGGVGTVATVGATALANGASTLVNGAALGSKFSITSDNGKNFTYTFGANFASVTWGDLVNALNASNIGVTATVLSGTNQLQLSATDNATGFRIDGTTDRNVIDDIGTLTSGTNQTYNSTDMFVNGAVAPINGQEGFVIANGGQVTTVGTALTVKTTAIAASTATAPQSLTFIGGDGIARTWSNGATATTSQGFIDQINAMNAGVKAEFINVGGTNMQVRLRNTSGGAMQILNGAGVFAPGATGALRFSATIGQQTVSGAAASSNSNSAQILAYGQQYDSIMTQLTQLVSNNPVQAGRNLLAGQNSQVVMDEFGGNAITINGVNVNNTMLTLTTAGATWSTGSNIQTSATQANTAYTTIQDLQAKFSTFSSYMQARYDINKSYGTDMKTLADELVAADVAEESAKLSALQSQQQFAVQAFSMGSQNAQGLLRLLG